MITPYLVQCFIISFIVTNCFGFRNHSPYHVYHVYHAQCATTRKAQRWAYRSLTVPICQPLPSDSLMMTCVANCKLQFLPSGKLLHNYRTSPFCIGKSTISRGIFNSQLLTEPGWVAVRIVTLLSHPRWAAEFAKVDMAPSSATWIAGKRTASMRYPEELTGNVSFFACAGASDLVNGKL